jgi:hypothetical protein
MKFNDFWNIQFGSQEIFTKSESLTKKELVEVQQMIYELQQKGYNSSKIIKALQQVNKKLAEKWRAERTYWTEVKRQETDKIKEAGDALDIKEYYVILSPNACDICKKKSENGRKVFKGTDLQKDGYGHIPPFHPNCYCILVPK